LEEHYSKRINTGVIARSTATKQSHTYTGETSEIATLPLVARNDIVTTFNAFVLVELLRSKGGMRGR